MAPLVAEDPPKEKEEEPPTLGADVVVAVVAAAPNWNIPVEAGLAAATFDPKEKLDEGVGAGAGAGATVDAGGLVDAPKEKAPDDG